MNSEVNETDAIREQISDILFSVSNKNGSSHLFTPELCFDVTDEILKVIEGSGGSGQRSCVCYAGASGEGKGGQQDGAVEILISLIELRNSGLWEESRANLQFNKARDLLGLW